MCRKLSFRDGAWYQTTIVKNASGPYRTDQIVILLSLFPRAKFIYFYTVITPTRCFASACHMADTTYLLVHIFAQQLTSNEQIQEFILLRQYEILWDCYDRDRELLQQQQEHQQSLSSSQPQPQQLIKVVYDDLTTNPVATVQRIYQAFGWFRRISHVRERSNR